MKISKKLKEQIALANKKIKLHVKTGDKVKVISGDDKGKVGEVLKVLTKKLAVIVEEVNLKKKLINNGEKKESATIPYPIDISNVKKIK